MEDSAKILSVQDISCLGQCSNTVMLPLLSAAGLETVVLPTALLSTHTGGFRGFTFLDLTEEMEKILAHFCALSVRFDYLCTGYFGSREQIQLLKRACEEVLVPGALRFIDPVMGDNGQLYSIYDETYVSAMRSLCRDADYITPNLTEACLLAGVPYTGERYDRARAGSLLAALHALGAKNILLTGVRFDDATIGVVGMDAKGATFTASAPFVDRHFHGTGDVLAGALFGNLARGVPFARAAHRAVTFVSHCIADTVPVMDKHWYGLRFEGRLWEIAASPDTEI